MNLTILAYAIVCVFAAAVVRGFSGFGFSLLTIISLSLVMPPKVVVPAMFFLELAAGINLLPGIWRSVDWKAFRILLIAIAAGTPLGMLALTHAPEPPLKVALAVFVLIAVALLWSGWRLTRMPTRVETLATGLAGGALNGAFGIGGPPLIIFFLGSPIAAAAGRASLIACFLGMDLIGLPMLFAFGLVTRESFILAAILFVPLLVGIYLGTRLVGRFEERTVRKAMLALLAVLAAAIGAQGLTGLSG